MYESNTASATPFAPQPYPTNSQEREINTIAHRVLKVHHVHIFARLEIETPRTVEIEVKMQDKASMIMGQLSLNPSP